MNQLLRRTTDDLIDLIEQMLCKDWGKRIDMLSIYDHPWIVKYKRKHEMDSDDQKSDTSSSFHSDEDPSNDAGEANPENDKSEESQSEDKSPRTSR